ncbi:YgfZ/GcvT domain-containing protein [Luteimonas deserti]|uniref:Folate-binding protein YgfZ n=1 Tax=Luteimonas deserti TaxID=2752306 RepID=A0A7Z0U081_9GAMM|nr:folate-binding protein YgfZ [Luteimonas deserti]NYZ64192.1 folate-binding protein YgfZ [Luteimonas deserti]
MSDKPRTAPTFPFLLPDIHVVTLRGRDARAFAQAQFMNDVDALVPGAWHWSGWLTPKGRVIALFALVRCDTDSFYVVLLDADPVAFVAALQRFIFRSKVELAAATGLVASGTWSMPSDGGGHVARIDGEAVQLDLGAAAHPRILCMGPAAAAPVVDSEQLARWRSVDLGFGLPRLPTDQAGTWTPQQLSLDRLRAFSVRKGCYPGQEIVARTHFLGQARRGLVALHGAAAASAGDDVAQDGQTIGRLVSVASEVQLAVLPLERPDLPLSVGASPVVAVPLSDGLAR